MPGTKSSFHNNKIKFRPGWKVAQQEIMDDDVKGQEQRQTMQQQKEKQRAQCCKDWREDTIPG